MSVRLKNKKKPKKITPSQLPVKINDPEKSRTLLIFLNIALSLFIFLSIQYPKSMGIMGEIVVNKFGKFISGQALGYLPIFMLISAISLIYKSKTKTTFIALLSSFFIFTVAFELHSNSVIRELVWPIPTNGGGVLGYFGLYFFHYIFGSIGVRLLIPTVIIMSVLALFPIPFRKITHWLITTTIKDEDLSHTSDTISKKLKKIKEKSKTEKSTIPTKKIEDLDSLNTPDIEELPKTSGISFKLNVEEPNDVKKVSNLVKRSDSPYKFPPLSIFEKVGNIKDKSKLLLKGHQEKARILEEALHSFNVEAKVINITPGPTITRYELQPGVGVKISKITGLSNDIALKLAAPSVRIEAPIPGKALIGIEIPNPTTEMISIRHIAESTDFLENQEKLLCALGVTIAGDPIIMDIGKMPHILIAGATGSGKSVCITSIIISILLRTTPEEVKFLMIDPKKVELSLFDDIPHLLAPVVTDPHKAAATLKKWALLEMENRYELFSQVGVKNIAGYNGRINEILELEKTDAEEAKKQLDQFLRPGDDEFESVEFNPEKLPYIIVVIDELADLMMVAAQDVENTICRLAQMSRATGIHLVIATQRPSVNVITGLIKANVPSRISFYLQSQIDSRTVLDMGGAEKLLGKGDMLYSPVGSFKPQRLQGIYISEKEIKAIVDHVKSQAKPHYLDEILDIEPLEDSKTDRQNNAQDELYEAAKEIVMSTQYASTSYLQRKLRIGYNRAARIMDELKENGVLTQYSTNSKPNT